MQTQTGSRVRRVRVCVFYRVIMRMRFQLSFVLTVPE